MIEDVTLIFELLTKKSVSKSLVVLCLFALFACAGSSGFSGTGKSQNAKPQPQLQKADEKKESDSADDDNTTDADDPANNPNNPLGNPSTDTPAVTAAEPDPSTSVSTMSSTSVSVEPPIMKVEGQEVLNTCDACMSRAKALGETIGLNVATAYISNRGGYKTPKQGLCDIHFLPSPYTAIADHEGQESSILGNQIALYCPCDCPFVGSSMGTSLPGF